MAKKKVMREMDFSTEEKIKNAARVVFQKKGLAAARTRDIAEEAGVNLALLNYYFRSKEKLFEIIMYETLTNFAKGITGIFNDENTTLEEKIGLLVEKYLEMLTNDPNIPMFILSEIRNRPKDLLEKLPAKSVLSNSVAINQFGEMAAGGEFSEKDIPHLLMNLLGLTVFPFVGKPFIMALGGLDELEFNTLMQERKKMIPLWMKTMMSVK
ncbi:MAG: TetR/AcrR family transcriptional regulator [Paludibacter sp.]|nr:TetR/AcrR family transcriptional regulator [Paludibacter sp.]